MYIRPAYGRDYKNVKELKEDLAAGKDFQLCATGQYCSIRDFPAGTEVLVRYKKSLQTTVVKITPEMKERANGKTA